MIFKRICVVGAGTIGSLCAVHIAHVAEVSLLVRREDHAKALKANGLRVTGKSEIVPRVFATTDPSELSDPDLVLATKATHLENAVGQLGGRFPNATFMTIQNGTGSEEVVARHGDWPIVSSVTFRSDSPTEVDYILGSLVREAHRADIDVPMALALYRLVKAREIAALAGGGSG